MAFAQSTIIQRVRDLLGENPWQTLGAAASSTGTCTVLDTTRWDEGAIGEFQDNGEQFWVRAVDTGTNTDLTVLRAINGTTGAIHAASTVVYRDPTFTYNRIKDSIDLVTANLWPYAWKRNTKMLTYDSTKTWYDLTNTVMGIIQVSQVAVSGQRVIVYGAGSSQWASSLPTSTVSSGIGMIFPNGWDNQTNQIQVDYAEMITSNQTTAGTYSDISDGLLADLITHGAAARLVSASENYRVTQEDIGMGDSSVVPSSRIRAGSFMQSTYMNLLRRYQVELMRQIPLRPNDAANPYTEGRLWGAGYYSTPPWG